MNPQSDDDGDMVAANGAHLWKRFSGGGDVDPGRQRLSQRRKAAAFTQGSSTGLLAAEPSIVTRRETENSGPPAQTRPNVASAAQASTGQHAGLFTESPFTEPQTNATPAPTNAEGPVRAVTRPPEAAKPAPAQPTQAWRPYRPASSATSARSWRLKRFPAAGLLVAALAGGTTSVLVGPPHRVPVPPDSAEIPTVTAPVAAIPASDPVAGTSTRPQDPMAATHPAPAAEPDKALDSGASARTNTVPSAAEIRSEHRTTIRRKPVVPTAPDPSSNRPTAAEVYDAWARAAGFNANDRRWPDVRSESPSHR